MPFKKGESGNPRGRPLQHAEAAKIRQQILRSAPEIVTALIDAARSGDSGAGRTLLACICGPMKAVEQTVTLNIPDADLALQGRAVIAALSAGKIAPGQASQILAGLGAVAKLIEVTQLESRIAALEGKS